MAPADFRNNINLILKVQLRAANRPMTPLFAAEAKRVTAAPNIGAQCSDALEDQGDLVSR